MKVGDKVVINSGLRGGEIVTIINITDDNVIWCMCSDGAERWYLPYELLPFGMTKEEAEPVPDLVNNPKHYTAGGIECYDFIESWDMSFPQGNVIKYVTRYKLKGGVEDLKKARWYLDKLIADQMIDEAE